MGNLKQKQPSVGELQTKRLSVGELQTKRPSVGELQTKRPSVGTPLFSQFWVVLVDTKHATSVCESLLGSIGAYKTRNECMRMFF